MCAQKEDNALCRTPQFMGGGSINAAAGVVGGVNEGRMCGGIITISRNAVGVEGVLEV